MHAGRAAGRRAGRPVREVRRRRRPPRRRARMTPMTDTDLRSLTEKAAPPATVGAYLAEQLGDDAGRDGSIALGSGGKPNLAFIVTPSAGDVVLRRPPLSTVLPTA